MATVSPTSARCPAEPHTGQGAYLKFEITSVSDSDAAANKRYVSWKITFQGTPWVQLFKAYAKLGNKVIYDKEPGTTGWSVGTVLKSDTTTFDNDSAGNLTLAFYMKQLFFYGTWAWDQSGYAQEKNETFRFSQLPRYAAFTSHTATSELNKITVSYTSDVEYKAQQYSLNGGSWTNTTAGSYNLTGLTPNTSYTIKTKIQRADSNLWTESDTITIKTKALPTSIAPSDILFNKDGNTFTPSISSVDYLSGWYVIVKDGSTQVRSYSGTQSTTSSKTYTLQGSDFTAMLPRHTTTDNWNLTVQYKVISNGTTYTLTDRTFKCTIPAGQYLPIYNVNNLSYAVTDSKTLGLNNNNTTKVIKGVSSVKITSTAASPQGSASMSSYIASSGTKQKSGTTTTAPIEISLDNVDGSSFSVQAVDSRNRSTTATKNYAAFIDYFAPIVDSANITRVDAIGTNINVNIVGRYMNWSGLATSNTIEQVSIKYRIKGATSWTTKTGITFTRSVGNGNFTITGVITGNNFVATNEYELQLTFKDKIGNFIVLANIPVGDSLLWRDLANKRIGIGKKPTQALDVKGNGIVSGNMTATKFIGTCSNSEKLTTLDTRAVNSTPGEYMRSGRGVKYEFKNNNAIGNPLANTYSGLLTITPWGNNSGGRPTQMAVNTNGFKYRHSKDDENWGSWFDFGLLAYPVGSIYISVNNTNPGTLFGGTWEQIKDRFLLACGDAYINGSTGGRANHKHPTSEHILTVEEMPKHSHDMDDAVYGNYKNRLGIRGDGGGGKNLIPTMTQTDGYSKYLPTDTGGGKPHSHGDTGSANHMPPYLAVYMWKRTA